MALDCGGYAIPQAAEGEEQTTREGLVSEILSAQCPDGGWTLLGEASDVDMTAMALTSLSPYLENRDRPSRRGAGVDLPFPRPAG